MSGEATRRNCMLNDGLRSISSDVLAIKNIAWMARDAAIDINTGEEDDLSDRRCQAVVGLQKGIEALAQEVLDKIDHLEFELQKRGESDGDLS